MTRLDLLPGCGNRPLHPGPGAAGGAPVMVAIVLDRVLRHARDGVVS